MEIPKRQTELWTKEDRIFPAKDKVSRKDQKVRKGLSSTLTSDKTSIVSEMVSQKDKRRNQQHPSGEYPNAAHRYGWIQKKEVTEHSPEIAKSMVEDTTQKAIAVTDVAAASGNPVATAATAAKKLKKTYDQVKQSFEQKDEGRNNGGLFLFLTSGIPFLLLVIIVSFCVSMFASPTEIPATEIVNPIVEVAEKEAASQRNIGGFKYKNWFGMNADWCAMFVSWCANECGYIEDGTMPKTASVASMSQWYKELGRYRKKESGYEPKPGDIIFFQNGMSHVGIVVEYDSDNKIITTVEGNTGYSGREPYHMGSQVKRKSYPLTYPRISGYGLPLYPQHDLEIPWPYGTELSFLAWSDVATGTQESELYVEEDYDADGFGIINGRYVVACTDTIGEVGDCIDFKLENGNTIKTIVGNTISPFTSGYNVYGKNNGREVIEFLVDKEEWYGKGKNPKTIHPDWNSRVVKATIVGNYWD